MGFFGRLLGKKKVKESFDLPDLSVDNPGGSWANPELKPEATEEVTLTRSQEMRVT